MAAQKKPAGKQPRKIRTSTLVFGIVVELIFSIIFGITAGARGLGTLYPQLNLVASPFVCPHGSMSSAQSKNETGTGTEWSARWFCVDDQTGARSEIDHTSVILYASPIYILLFFVTLLVITYVYWNSSVGPARNDDLHLW